MSGAFQTSREIFDHPIWQNVVEFRLFFLVYGMACFADGVKVGNVTLKRGQWVRSYRNLRDDLAYKEGRGLKKYGLATIRRAIDRLVKENRIEIKELECGTLFTVVNYNEYQGLRTQNQTSRNIGGTLAEHQRNISGTLAEHQRNKNKNAKNANKANKKKEEEQTGDKAPVTARPPTTDQARFVESFAALYEQQTGSPFKADKKHFIITARLIKNYGIDAVKQKAVLLAEYCKRAEAWFVKGGWADYTIETLSRHWNSIVPTEAYLTEEEREVKRWKERERMNAERDRIVEDYQRQNQNSR